MATHRKTCKRYDISGNAHFLTFSCYRRLPLLNRYRSRDWLIQAIRLAQEKAMFDLWAYVIMPEHVHLVLLPRENFGISEILTTIKQSTSKRAILWIRKNAPEFLFKIQDTQPNGKQSYRFWQRGGGYDRNLRSVRDIHEKIRYTHENPVRRNLVSQAVEWPWSSASAWATGSDKPLVIDRHNLPQLTTLDNPGSSGLMEGTL